MIRPSAFFGALLTATFFTNPTCAQTAGSNVVPLGGADIGIICDNGFYLTLQSVNGVTTLFCQGTTGTGDLSDIGTLSYHLGNDFNTDSGTTGSAAAYQAGGAYYVNEGTGIDYFTSTTFGKSNQNGNFPLVTSNYAPTGAPYYNFETAFNFYMLPDGRYHIQAISQNGMYNANGAAGGQISGGPDTGYWTLQNDGSVFVPDTQGPTGASTFALVLAPVSAVKQSFASADALDNLTNFFIQNSATGLYWTYANGAYAANTLSQALASTFRIANSTIHPGLNGLFDVTNNQYVSVPSTTAPVTGSANEITRQTEMIIVPVGNDGYVLWAQTNPGNYIVNQNSGGFAANGASPEVNTFVTNSGAVTPPQPSASSSGMASSSVSNVVSSSSSALAAAPSSSFVGSSSSAAAMIVSSSSSVIVLPPSSTVISSSSASQAAPASATEAIINLRASDASSNIFSLYEQDDGTVRTPYPMPYTASTDPAYLFSVTGSGTQLQDSNGRVLYFSRSGATAGTVVQSLAVGAVPTADQITNEFNYNLASGGLITVPGYTFYLNDGALLGLFATDSPAPADAVVVLSALQGVGAAVCQPDGTNCSTSSAASSTASSSASAITVSVSIPVPIDTIVSSAASSSASAITIPPVDVSIPLPIDTIVSSAASSSASAITMPPVSVSIPLPIDTIVSSVSAIVTDTPSSIVSAIVPVSSTSVFGTSSASIISSTSSVFSASLIATNPSATPVAGPAPATITQAATFVCLNCQTTTTFSTITGSTTTTGADGLATVGPSTTIIAIPIQYLVPCAGCTTQIITDNAQPITSTATSGTTTSFFVFPASQLGAATTTATVTNNVDGSTITEAIAGMSTSVLGVAPTSVSASLTSSFGSSYSNSTTSTSASSGSTGAPVSGNPGSKVCSTFLTGYSCVNSPAAATLTDAEIQQCAAQCSADATCAAFTVDPSGTCSVYTTALDCTNTPTSPGCTALATNPSAVGFNKASSAGRPAAPGSGSGTGPAAGSDSGSTTVSVSVEVPGSGVGTAAGSGSGSNAGVGAAPGSGIGFTSGVNTDSAGAVPVNAAANGVATGSSGTNASESPLGSTGMESGSVAAAQAAAAAASASAVASAAATAAVINSTVATAPLPTVNALPASANDMSRAQISAAAIVVAIIMSLA